MCWTNCFAVLIIAFSAIIDCAFTARLNDIYWNSSNPIFRIDNTDHIIDVNKGNVAYEYDQVNIICPVYSKGTREEDIETYIIYNVSKEEYDTCRITNAASARTIAVCDKPFLNRYYTITFRPFTPQPGGLEFRPGQDYYFISLSALPSLSAGRCNSHHMKVVFKVCCKRNSGSHALQTKLNSTVPTTTTTTTTTTRPTILSSSTTPRMWRIWTLSPNISNRVFPPESGHTMKRPYAYPKEIYYRFNNNSIIMTSRPSLMASQPSTSTSKSPSLMSVTAQTPYWWRPHFTKLPSNSLQSENNARSHYADHAHSTAIGVYCLLINIIMTVSAHLSANYLL